MEKSGDGSQEGRAWLKQGLRGQALQCAIDGCGDLAEQDAGAAYATYEPFDGKNVASRPDLGGFGAAMEALAAPLRAAGALRLGEPPGPMPV